MGSRDNSNEEAAVPAPPPELLEFVRRHIRNDLIDHSADRRKTEDINVVPAVVQPIDARYRTLGEPFAGVAHDGSSTDLGLVHDHATDSRLLAIEMRIAGEEVIAVAEVHWSRHLGPYHQLGGNFVAKLDHFPKPQDAMWFLTGKVNTPGTLRYVPIHTSPFIVGRRHDVSLYLSSKAVSSRHAELFARCNDLHVRDFGSTNGTFVNGEMVVNERRLAEGDLLQFGDVTLRVNRQMPSRGSVTAVENVWDQAMALKRFDDLLSKRNFSCCFQPIVGFDDVQPVAYEVLGRSRLFGLNSPQQMFLAAARLDRETELSLLLRREGIAAGQRLPGRPRLFVNTHPRELRDPSLLVTSLEEIRKEFPDQPVTLEIHEASATDPTVMGTLRSALRDMEMELAYDDFGAGQARLIELVEVPPDVLKFDKSLIQGIHAAGAKRQQLLAKLVGMVRDLGITALAEGVEQQDVCDACRQLGFDLGQGYFFGKPASAKECCELLGVEAASKASESPLS